MNGLPMGAAVAASRVGLIVALVAGVAADAPASGIDPHHAPIRLVQNTTGSAPELQGIGLTASHRRIIFENVAGERVQKLADDQKPSVGGIISDSIMLNEIPIAVKDQVGLLRDFKIAKLPGDNILIVDPASRKIVDIITREEGGR